MACLMYLLFGFDARVSRKSWWRGPLAACGLVP